METPSGYKELGLAGFTDKGTYSSSATYVKNDLVHDEDNSIWKCLIDDTTGITPELGDNWELFIRGFKNASKLPATDVKGILGTENAETDTQSMLTGLAEKFNSIKTDAGSVTAVDTSGMAGTAGEDSTAQALLDALAARVALFNKKEEHIRHDIMSRISGLPAAIASGHPELYGFYEGDYFTGASGYVYILADYDHWYGAYDSYAIVSTRHWGVLVNTKTKTKWADSSTAGGYVASTLNSCLSETVLPKVKTDLDALGLNLISNQRLYSNAVTTTAWNRLGAASGASTGWGWSTGQQISAPTESEMCGHVAFSSSGFDTGEGFKPLAACQKYRPNELLGNIYIWLRDVASASNACLLNNLGNADSFGVTDACYAVGLIGIY